jgi:hypothetical protein
MLSEKTIALYRSLPRPSPLIARRLAQPSHRGMAFQES